MTEKMKLTDYDPDDPPRVTHTMESQRLFGVFVGRLITILILLAIFGVDVENGIWDEGWVVIGLTLVLTARALWPALQGLEHGWVDVRQTADKLFS